MIYLVSMMLLEFVNTWNLNTGDNSLTSIMLIHISPLKMLEQGKGEGMGEINSFGLSFINVSLFYAKH